MHSFLLKESNEQNNYELTDGETFEACLDNAYQIIKDQIIQYDIPFE